MNGQKGLFVVAVALSVALIATACSKKSGQALSVTRESQQYSFSGFLDGIKKYPYVASGKKMERVRAGANKLSLGMSKKLVMQRMGAPDWEMLTSNRSGNDLKPVYSTWTYCLKRQERNLGTRGVDQELTLYFKTDGSLYWVYPMNMPGLRSQGGPQLNPDSLIRIQRD